MANEMTSSAPDSVQCPVCFSDFRPTAINGHLDSCLMKSATHDRPPTTPENEPPLKKCRVGAESEPPDPAVNNAAACSSSMAGTRSSAVFSVFQSNKSKASIPGDRSGFHSSKPGVAVNKAIKHNLASDAEHVACTENNVPGSNRQGLNSTNNVSPWTLLTIDKPLAEILRPNTLEEYFGQNKIIGQQTLLRSLLDSQEIPSLILWGPPGCGKVGRFIRHKTIKSDFQLSLKGFHKCGI